MKILFVASVSRRLCSDMCPSPPEQPSQPVPSDLALNGTAGGGGENVFEVCTGPLDEAAVIERVRDARAGAVVLFLGTVRELTGDRRTSRLEYEAHPTMAVKQGQQILLAARQRWPLVRVVVQHRVGRLELSETAVAVAVSTPHRADAFAAAQFIMDSIKELVPIWKQEQWADGTAGWIHPGLTVSPNLPTETASADDQQTSDQFTAPAVPAETHLP